MKNLFYHNYNITNIFQIGTTSNTMFQTLLIYK